jgi:hypothetical protein
MKSKFFGHALDEATAKTKKHVQLRMLKQFTRLIRTLWHA